MKDATADRWVMGITLAVAMVILAGCATQRERWFLPGAPLDPDMDMTEWLKKEDERLKAWPRNSRVHTETEPN